MKSSTSLKDVHVPDAAIQAWVLEREGVPLSGMEIMHLNRECTCPGLHDLFLREEVTDQVLSFLPQVPGLVQGQKKLLGDPLPEVEPGPHCSTPYECPFQRRCWPEPDPQDLANLYRGGRKVEELQEMEVEGIQDIPSDFRLSDIQARQREAARIGGLVVDKGLEWDLRPLLGPGAFLDFETVAPAVPRLEGCGPYTAVPVQYSCHLVDAHGEVTHDEWLARGSGDPRPEMARRLADLLEGQEGIIAYNAGFEKRCLESLAERAPEAAPVLLDTAGRLLDLLPVVRNHVYHPEFMGSFSLKAVLPAMVPGLSYQGLEISKGSDASAWLFKVLFEEGSFQVCQLKTLRGDLKAYCRVDTLALVKLRKVLESLI